MQLNSEQQEQLRQAKERGDHRVAMSFTPEQNMAWRDAVSQEIAGSDENIAQFHKIKSAAEQPGFFGDVRRAIFYSRRPIDQLAAEIGVDPRVLSDFRAAEGELSAAARNRLVEALGLRLMQEIPR